MKRDERMARRAAFDALPAPARQAIHERIATLLHAHRWIFASTMPENPHEYTRRRDWTNDADFVWVVEQIRGLGEPRKFQGRSYTQLDVGDHSYWTMGFPIDTRDGSPLTILINRKSIGEMR